MIGQGCTVIWNSDQSVMQPLSESLSKDPSTLVADSVVIKVVPQNGKIFGFVGPFIPIIPVWLSEAKNGFWFLISLLPKNGEITFSPSLVALKTERGDTFLPAGFTGPLRLADIIQNNSDPRKKLLDAKSLNVSVNPFSISAEVLVGVMFETKTIDPDQHFTLVLKGLEKGGHPIEVPPLKFSKERRRHFDFLLFDPLSIHTEQVVQ
jgi:hypothetical protein